MSKKVLSVGFGIWIGVSLFVLLGFVVYNTYFKAPPKEKIIETFTTILISKPFLQRMEVNEKVNEMVSIGQLDDVVEIYTERVKSREIIHLLLFRAITTDIPVNLLFALVDVESDFNPTVVSEVGAVGLMQLVPKWFKPLTRQELKTSEVNTLKGCEHLKDRYKKYGSWEQAAYYYYGETKNRSRGNPSLEYLVRVLNEERYYDDLFNKRIGEDYEKGN